MVVEGYSTWGSVSSRSDLGELLAHKARYGDVIELAKYTYENTPPRGQMDRLRELVIQYMVHEANQIIGSEKYLSLVENGGPFARDLLSMVLKRSG